jgi:hypothetical protein
MTLGAFELMVSIYSPRDPCSEIRIFSDHNHEANPGYLNAKEIGGTFDKSKIKCKGQALKVMPNLIRRYLSRDVTLLHSSCLT